MDVSHFDILGFQSQSIVGWVNSKASGLKADTHRESQYIASTKLAQFISIFCQKQVGSKLLKGNDQNVKTGKEVFLMGGSDS